MTRLNAFLLACAMLLLYIGATVLCFWKVLPGDIVFLAPDAPILPVLEWFPLSLQNTLMNLLPHRFAYEGTFWVDGFVMCLAGVFALRARNVRWGAAWVGGFCAAYAGYFSTLFCAGHRGVVDALAVTCLCFGALDRALTTGQLRWFALVGLFSALGLGAQADLWTLVTCALGAYGLWLLCVERPSWKRWVPGIALALAVFLLVGWPALRSTFTVARAAREAQITQVAAQASATGNQAQAQETFITNWSLPPEDLLEALIPSVYGHTSYGFDPDPYRGRMGMPNQPFRQHTLHIGLYTLLLALFAWLQKRSPEVRDRAFWSGLALVALLLALGRFTPIYKVVTALPVLGEIRAPVKWWHLTGFALAILAGLGAARLLRRWSDWAALPLCALIALCGALVARPYVFPIDLSPTPILQAVTPTDLCYNAPKWPLFDQLCHWHGRRLTADPAQATLILTIYRPDLPGKPLATQTLPQGITLALYRIKPAR